MSYAVQQADRVFRSRKSPRKPQPAAACDLSFAQWERGRVVDSVASAREPRAERVAASALQYQNSALSAQQRPYCWMCERFCTAYGWAQMPSMLLSRLQFRPVSAFTLCTTCATALSLQPGTAIKDVVARCNQTQAAKARSLSFVAFLREYKMLLELIALDREGESPGSAFEPFSAGGGVVVPMGVLEQLLGCLDNTLAEVATLCPPERNILLAECRSLQLQMEVAARRNAIAQNPKTAVATAAASSPPLRKRIPASVSARKQMQTPTPGRYMKQVHASPYAELGRGTAAATNRGSTPAPLDTYLTTNRSVLRALIEQPFEVPAAVTEQAFVPPGASPPIIEVGEDEPSLFAHQSDAPQITVSRATSVLGVGLESAARSTTTAPSAAMGEKGSLTPSERVRQRLLQWTDGRSTSARPGGASASNTAPTAPAAQAPPVSKTAAAAKEEIAQHLQQAASEFAAFEEEHYEQLATWQREKRALETRSAELDKEVVSLRDQLRIRDQECCSLQTLNTQLNERLLVADSQQSRELHFLSINTMLSTTLITVVEAVALKATVFGNEALQVARHASDSVEHARKLAADLAFAQKHLQHQYRLLEASRRAVVQAWSDKNITNLDTSLSQPISDPTNRAAAPSYEDVLRAQMREAASRGSRSTINSPSTGQRNKQPYALPTPRAARQSPPPPLAAATDANTTVF